MAKLPVHGPSQELQLPTHVHPAAPKQMQLKAQAEASVKALKNPEKDPYHQQLKAASKMMHQHAGIRRGRNMN